MTVHRKINPAVSQMALEECRYRGWTVDEFAARANASKRLAQSILDGTANFYRSTAWRLADAFGTSRELWINLQDAPTFESLVKEIIGPNG